MKKFQPMHRIRQFFNRSKAKRSKKSNSSHSALMASSSKSKKFTIVKHSDDSQHTEMSPKKAMKRSSPSKRHLNTDGSSFDQLGKLCKKLPYENQHFTHQRGNSIDLESGKYVLNTNASQPTLKSDGSSGRQLQIILEKLIDDDKITQRPDCMLEPKNIENFMHGKQLNNLNYYVKADRKAHDHNVNQNFVHNCESKTNDEVYVQSSDHDASKFRYEMSDPNAQAKLFLNTRKKKTTIQKKRSSRRGDKQNEMILNKYKSLVPALEVQSTSMKSMSSCSIDSAIDSIGEESMTSSHSARSQDEESHAPNSKYFESISCQASQLSEDFKTALVESYDVASRWFGCINLQVDV